MNFWSAFGAKAERRKAVVIYTPSFEVVFESVIVIHANQILAIKARKLISRIIEFFP